MSYITSFSLNMIIGGVLLCLSLTSSLAFNFPRSKNVGNFIIRPGEPSPLHVDRNVHEVGQLVNSMMRRRVTGHKQKLKNKQNDWQNHDDLKSLELDDSLEGLLALDAQRQKQKKKKLGLKVVNVDDFISDRNKKAGDEKLKLIQSLDPPDHFFKKYKSSKVEKKAEEKSLNKFSNLGYKVVNVDKFDHDRMIKKNVKLIQSLDPPKKFFQRYRPDALLNEFSTLEIPQTKHKKRNLYSENKRKPVKSIFDENGMLYLTKPKHSEGRKINYLINKVLKIKDKQGNGIHLRQPEKQFTNEELQEIQLIARAIDEDYIDNNERNNLDELLQAEKQLRNQQSDFADEVIGSDQIQLSDALRSKKRSADHYLKHYVKQLISKTIQENENTKLLDGLILSHHPKTKRHGVKHLKQVERALENNQNPDDDNLQFNFDELVV